MLQEQVLQALQIQMGNELKNSYIYKSFAGIADYLALLGTCDFFQKQSKEEYKHFEKFFEYISDQGHIPHLQMLEEIPPKILSIQELFSQSFLLEKQTLENLKKVSDVCKEMKDDQTFGLLQWYLEEQIEEVKSADDRQKRVLMSLNNILIFDNDVNK